MGVACWWWRGDVESETDQGLATARVVESGGSEDKEMLLPSALLAVSDVEVSLQLRQNLVVE